MKNYLSLILITIIVFVFIFGYQVNTKAQEETLPEKDGIFSKILEKWKKVHTSISTWWKNSILPSISNWLKNKWEFIEKEIEKEKEEIKKDLEERFSGYISNLWQNLKKILTPNPS